MSILKTLDLILTDRNFINMYLLIIKHIELLYLSNGSPKCFIIFLIWSSDQKVWFSGHKEKLSSTGQLTTLSFFWLLLLNLIIILVKNFVIDFATLEIKVCFYIDLGIIFIVAYDGNFSLITLVDIYYYSIIYFD